MKTKKFAHRKNVGLLLVAAGILLWLLPFTVVAIDNVLGTTKPADLVIGNFGLIAVTVSPVLILVGILLTVLRFTRH